MKKYYLYLLCSGLTSAAVMPALVTYPVCADAAKETQTTSKTLDEKVEEMIESIDPESESFESYGYKRIQPGNTSDLKPGDLIVTRINGRRHVQAYISHDDVYIIKDVGVFISGKYSITSTSVFYRYEKQPAPSVPTLSAQYGDVLRAVALPSGYEWKNDSKALKDIGHCTAEALYTGGNDLMFEQNVLVNIEVTKKKVSIQQPSDKYTVVYKPGISSDQISLPKGWKFARKITNLKSGTYNVIYSGDLAHYDYGNSPLEKLIYVSVEKAVPSFNSPSAITVNYGAQISDKLLPAEKNGIFSFEKSGIFTSTGTYTCQFIPKDKEHYQIVKGIPVYVQVRPQKTASSGSKPSGASVSSMQANKSAAKAVSKTTSPVKKNTSSGNLTTGSTGSSASAAPASSLGTGTHFNHGGNTDPVTISSETDPLESAVTSQSLEGTDTGTTEEAWELTEQESEEAIKIRPVTPDEEELEQTEPEESEKFEETDPAQESAAVTSLRKPEKKKHTLPVIAGIVVAAGLLLGIVFKCKKAFEKK